MTDAQKQQFMNFINSDSYMRKHEGEVVGRNGHRSPWVNQIDLSFRQEIPGFFAGNKGELRFDLGLARRPHRVEAGAQVEGLEAVPPISILWCSAASSFLPQRPSRTSAFPWRGPCSPWRTSGRLARDRCTRRSG